MEPSSSAHMVAELGNWLALVALPLLGLMVLLGSRSPLIERRLGLERQIRLHKLLGPLVVGLMLGHIVCKFGAVAMRSTPEKPLDLIELMSKDEDRLMGLRFGQAAMGLTLVGAGLAQTARFGMPFPVWKTPHLAFYAVVAAALAHPAILVGLSLDEADMLVFWVLTLLLLLVGLLPRLLYVLRRPGSCVWTVADVRRETADVATLKLERAEGPGSFGSRTAGQFLTLRTKGTLGWGEPHPFTITAPPSSANLAVTVKASGDFSRALGSTATGTKVLCEGPYGLFHPAPPVGGGRALLVAGGIGVTPYLCALREAAAKPVPGTSWLLIWALRTREDAVALDELRRLAASIDLKIVLVLSRETVPSATDGPVSVESGHVTADLLRRHAGADFTGTAHLCGPPPMEKAALAALTEGCGIARGEVRGERFSW